MAEDKIPKVRVEELPDNVVVVIDLKVNLPSDTAMDIMQRLSSAFKSAAPDKKFALVCAQVDQSVTAWSGGNRIEPIEDSVTNLFDITYHDVDKIDKLEIIIPRMNPVLVEALRGKLASGIAETFSQLEVVVTTL
ncbi:hypothetical protein MYOV003v1_p0182 [Vibrio phage 207E48.1]|nr:hypothetical protein MYOV003v1_p0182 [Vibrio phage 207E48.1]